MADPSFKQELAAAQARIKAEAEKPKKKYRYKTQGRLIDTVRMYGRPSTPKVMQLVISFDIIQQMFRHRESHNPKVNLTKLHWGHLRLEVRNFKDAGIPGCLIRIEPHGSDPRGPRLRKLNGWRFTAGVSTKLLGLRDGTPSQTLETMWWSEPKEGLVLIFRDEDWRWQRGEKLPVKEVFADLYEEREQRMPQDQGQEHPDGQTPWAKQGQ